MKTMSETISLEFLEGISSELGDAVQGEINAKNDVIKAKAQLVEYEAIILADGYNDGTINGKNADARKQQEAALLRINPRRLEILKEIDVLEGVYAYAAGNLAGHTARVNLIRAWLYSQSHIER
jgi:gamma-glutamylcyclotransferase (GGCT)/AIG2-like uncharacterized protein YtfP